MSNAAKLSEAYSGRELTLNEIALRLAKVPEVRSKTNIAVAPLLSLLRDDALSAFAWYPSQVLPRIKVPAKYWRSIDNARFKQIISQSGKRSRKGTYLIPVDSLFDTYLDEVFAVIGTDASPDARDHALRVDLRAVVACFEETREVTVPEEAWTKFLANRRWVESPEKASKGRGRPEKAWSDLIPFLIAEMVGPDAKLNEKSPKMAQSILEAAKADGRENLPLESSLTERIYEWYRTLDKLHKR
jgi:hypothetical protein